MMAEGVTKSTLKNGIRILTMRMPYIRSVSMGVWVNCGGRDETAEENGLSHLIEHMIFKGTRRRSAYQIAKEFDAIGGQTNAFTSLENTCYHAKVMDTHLAPMVDVLSDIFLNSVFADDELERERPVILQEIGMVEDSPEEYIHVLNSSNFWNDHPLGRSILGSRENVRRFDTAGLKRFFHRLYQPDRIVISAAGNLNHEHFVDLVADNFSNIQPGTGFSERIPPIAHNRTQIHPRDIEQVHLCLSATGVHITDDRRFAFSLLNTILGGNMSSRLFQEIRERRGLAYSVYSFSSSYVDSGVAGIYAGVDPANAVETVRLILAEIEKLKTNPVTEEELGGAKEFTRGSLLLSAESNENQMVRLAQSDIHFNRYVPIGEVTEKIDKVTVDDVTELAETLFAGNRLGLTVLGPVDDSAKFRGILK